MLTLVRFTIVPSESRIEISGRSSLHPIQSVSRDLRGYFDAAWDERGELASDPAPALHVEMPVASLTSGNAFEDKQMQHIVGSRSFPNIVAHTQDVRAVDSQIGRYAVRGRVEVRGTGRQIDGEIGVRRAGDRIAIEGEKTVDVRQFGIQPPRILMLQVYPDVIVRLRVVAAA